MKILKELELELEILKFNKSTKPSVRYFNL